MQSQRENGVIVYNQQSLEKRRREGRKLDGAWICSPGAPQPFGASVRCLFLKHPLPPSLPTELPTSLEDFHSLVPHP